MQKLINLQQSVFTLKPRPLSYHLQTITATQTCNDTGTLSEHLCNILNLILIKLFSLSKPFEIQKNKQKKQLSIILYDAAVRCPSSICYQKRAEEIRQLRPTRRKVETAAALTHRDRTLAGFSLKQNICEQVIPTGVYGENS